MTEQELANIRKRLEMHKSFGPPEDGIVTGFDWYALDVSLLLAELGALQRRLFAAEQDCAHWKEQSEDQATKVADLRRKVEAVEGMLPDAELRHDKLEWRFNDAAGLEIGGKTPWEALGLREATKTHDPTSGPEMNGAAGATAATAIG